MKTIIKTLRNTLIFLLSSTYIYAQPALPVSTQTTDKQENEKVEIIDEIKIEAQSSSTINKNPKLKQGDACSDENLEEAKGELIVEIPMAKTIPCDKVDCKDLAPAKLYKDNYKKLKTAKTISCGAK